ncbi:MAG: xanthine dehydrogenase accessory protein XdhC [Pseudomonadota bacterium]|nr:xanthine dehydrogenase accessory protein XdhC [Pseudomonadota bacterium]
MRVLDAFLQRLARQRAVLVVVAHTEGSAPREPGAWMAVWPDGALGTIGGGQLEWQATAEARAWLAASGDTAPAPAVRRYALGPALGQCCGGVVHVRFESVCAADAPALRTRLAPAHASVAVFGGGHVGQALVRLLADLPFDVQWVDSRDEVFPADTPAHVRLEHSAPVHAAVAELPPGTRVLIMSFSHAEDLDIVAACLQRQRARDDLPFIGLIGSRTKWASFASRLRARGFADDELARVRCPIGVAGIHGKQPAVVAVAVAAQLLQQGGGRSDAW